MIGDSTGIGATVGRVAAAIRRAAQATGANFQYLLAAAKVESNFDPSASAAKSSAGGLFQFVDQTWLSTLKSAGPALGYGRYADAIVQTPSGGYTVPDPAMRRAVLNLRNDPAANAAMAGAFTRENAAHLHDKLGRAPTGGELYIAHFLGSAGAAKLIAGVGAMPNTPGANLFPAAAEANRAIFYDQQGHARSVGDVYRTLVGRFERARAGTAELAATSPVASIANGSEPAAEVVGVNDAFSMVSAVPVAHGADNEPVFHSLFQTGGRVQPISPLVGLLWGGSAASLQSTGEGELRRLFQDGSPDFRGVMQRPS